MKRFFTLASIAGILAANVTAAPAQTSGGTTPYGGYEDGTFGPKAFSTRAEAAVVIYRVIHVLHGAD